MKKNKYLQILTVTVILSAPFSQTEYNLTDKFEIGNVGIIQVLFEFE